MTVGTVSSSGAGQSARAVSQGRRYFHTAAAVIMLALTVAGFAPYYLRGVGTGERTIV